MSDRKVPKATLHRYPVYLKALRKLKAEGVDKIMSRELADYVSIEATTIRRDFSFLGSLGKQGYGYNVDDLIAIFSDELGVSFDEKIILIGAGNLGRALLNYNNWHHIVGEIVCAFDIHPENVRESPVPVYSLEELDRRIPEGCRIAILCISRDVQQTVDLLIGYGIRGFVNFTTEHFQVPQGINVRHVDVVSSIQELVFETNALEKEEGVM